MSTFRRNGQLVPHVFARSQQEPFCKCGASIGNVIHVRARDVPREEEIEFGFPKPCETCGSAIHRSNDYLTLNWMHGDRLGEGPIYFCSVGCAAIYCQHQTDLVAARSGA
jgi:hypothetical protein